MSGATANAAVARPETAADACAPSSPLNHGIVILVAAGIFALIARGVATKKIHAIDQSAREAAQSLRTHALDVAVKPVTILSVLPLVASATAALAFWLRHERRAAAALATAVTPLVAAAAGQSFTTFLAQRNPPDRSDTPNGEVTEPSFPSGHTTGVTAEALSIAYILSREELLSPAVLAGLLAWPLLVSTARLYRDRHWLSDILGGLAAGTAVAGATSLLYDVRKAKEA